MFNITPAFTTHCLVLHLWSFEDEEESLSEVFEAFTKAPVSTIPSIHTLEVDLHTFSHHPLIDLDELTPRQRLHSPLREREITELPQLVHSLVKLFAPTLQTLRITGGPMWISNMLRFPSKPTPLLSLYLL